MFSAALYKSDTLFSNLRERNVNSVWKHTEMGKWYSRSKDADDVAQHTMMNAKTYGSQDNKF